MASKWAMRFMWTVLAATGMFAAFVVGDYRGRSIQIQKEARRDVDRLYRYLRHGDIEGAYRDGLLHSESKVSASEVQAKWGKALESHVDWQRVGPFGLPVFFSLSVKREKGLTTEFVTRHWAGGPALDLGAEVREDK